MRRGGLDQTDVMFIILNKSTYLSAIINIIRSESPNAQVSHMEEQYSGKNGISVSNCLEEFLLTLGDISPIIVLDQLKGEGKCQPSSH